MKNVFLASPLALFVATAVACSSKSGDSMPSAATASAGPSDSHATAKPRATSASTDPGAGTPSRPDPGALDATVASLKAHPPLVVPYDWQKRVRAHLTGPSGGACPTPAPKQKNEFDQPAESPCKADNDKAVAFLQVCPALENIVVRVSKYDFKERRFVLSHSEGDPVLLTETSKAWFPGWFQLEWRTVLASWQVGGASKDMCDAGAHNDTERAVSTLAIPLPMEEGKAKELREKLDDELAKDHDRDARVQVAYILDGKTAADAAACGSKPAQALPSGRVVGWRLVVAGAHTTIDLTGWIAVTPWEWSDRCSDAASFFGATAPGATSAAPSASSAPASTSTKTPVSGASGGSTHTVRIACPESTDAMPHRFGCACHANDGTSPLSVSAPPGRKCKDMPGAEGRDCVFECE